MENAYKAIESDFHRRIVGGEADCPKGDNQDHLCLAGGPD